MSILSGVQIGSDQSDLFVGEIQIVDLSADEDRNAAGILNATIDGLNGNDGVSGTATLNANSIVASIVSAARGISNSVITDSGFDDDVFTGTALSNGFENQGEAKSFGVINSSISGGNGDDAFNFSGTGQSAEGSRGTGVESSAINGDGFNDRITISGVASSGGPSGSDVSAANRATAAGARNSVIRGGGEKDTIVISANAQSVENAQDGTASANGVEGGWVLGDADNDSMLVTAEASGAEANASGVLAANMYGGDGEDIMSFAGIGNGSGQNGAQGVGAGVSEGSVISGGNGSDVMTISGEASANGPSIGTANAYGVDSSLVFGGAGNDAILIFADSSGLSETNAYGIYQSGGVRAGEGSDRIIVSATATALDNAAAYGLYESNLYGDGGADQIIISSTTQASSGRGGVGAFKSQVSGGGGDDSISIEALARAEFDIQDSLIFGGSGDDLIDIGIGSGRIIGGQGNDTVVLDYFDASTMTVDVLSNLVEISGTQNKLGEAQAWRQNIFGVEQFQVQDTIYSTETLAAAFSV